MWMPWQAPTCLMSSLSSPFLVVKDELGPQKCPRKALHADPASHSYSEVQVSPLNDKQSTTSLYPLSKDIFEAVT